MQRCDHATFSNVGKRAGFKVQLGDLPIDVDEEVALCMWRVLHVHVSVSFESAECEVWAESAKYQV